jgi:hypothetical protein
MALENKGLLDQIETLKKAAFLHDLGKLLNWSGALHPLESGRLLQHLGFDETVVGVALYHHGPKHGYRKTIEKWIKDGADCAGLKPYADYGNRYALVMGELVDKVMTGFDRLGERNIGRTSPIVLRNPLTHLPLNGNLKQFKASIQPDRSLIPNAVYLREYVESHYIGVSGAKFKQLDKDNEKWVYVLDNALKNAPLLKVLAQYKDGNFNTLYTKLHNHPHWQGLTRRMIPQGHHPPADTLALWYHYQFSSALMGLYYLEGVHTVEDVQAERNQLGKEPLGLKIGLLYVRLAGLTEYFNGAYRLPDFSGTEAIGDALKEAVRAQLLEARTDEGLPLVWEDSFFYEGHDDFLVMVPVSDYGAADESYVYQTAWDDPFRQVWEAALDTETVLRRAAQVLLSSSKMRDVLAVEPSDGEAFGGGSQLVENLKRLIQIKTAARCFAGFRDGSELTSRYGLVWNRLRTEASARLPSPQTGLAHFTGDVCDACRVNLAGQDPDPTHPREWADVDWRRNIIHDEIWPAEETGQPLRYWVFRSTSETPGEGDKLCHACLLRRILGHGTSLERIAGARGEEEEDARIAVIKGNVNRTRWFVGGSLHAAVPLTNANSTYARVWRSELSLPLARSSLRHGRRLAPADARQRMKMQSRWALGNSKMTAIDPEQEIQSQLADNKLQAASVPTELSNPWAPFPLNGSLDELVEWLFYGSPNFCQEAAAQDDHDLPTPSRTMTASQLIQEAVRQVQPLVDEIIPERWRPVVHTAGDEFLVICRAEDAPGLARDIFRTVVAHLNSVTEDWVEALDNYLPVTLAMGMVVAKRKHPMYGMLELVDQLVTNAKAAYANRNAIDFENVVGGVDEVNLDRPHYGRLWLSRRPLTLTEFARLLDDVTTLQQAEEAFPQRQLQQVSALMAHVPQDPMPETKPAHASRQAAALAYVLQQKPDERWEIVRRACEDGTFQDLWALYRWPRGEEEST